MYSHAFPELNSSLTGVQLIINAVPISTGEPHQGTASSSKETIQIRTEKYSSPKKQVQSKNLVSLNYKVSHHCCQVQTNCMKEINNMKIYYFFTTLLYIWILYNSNVLREGSAVSTMVWYNLQCS